MDDDNKHNFNFVQTNFVNSATCSRCGRYLVGGVLDVRPLDIEALESDEVCSGADETEPSILYLIDLVEMTDHVPEAVRQWLDNEKNKIISRNMIIKSTERVYKPLRESDKPYI